ncbi:MAG: hypothetical protein JWQ04_382 [Pedosphaera sp.]|nr:hypothetical protein [Pedosphaera sp.]
MKNFHDIVHAVGGLVVLGLWSVPIARGIKFLAYASHVYAEERSINSYNDYAYGREILFAYIVGLLISAGLVWLHHWTKVGLLWAHFGVSWIGVLFIIHEQPEAVITLIPGFAPMLVTAGYAVLGLAGLAASIGNCSVKYAAKNFSKNTI